MNALFTNQQVLRGSTLTNEYDNVQMLKSLGMIRTVRKSVLLTGYLIIQFPLFNII